MKQSDRNVFVLAFFVCSLRNSGQLMGPSGPAQPSPVPFSRSSPLHRYGPLDLGPSPFVDEKTGQCTLDPCDALGRARDELYTVLAEKEKIQAQSQTLVGELQATVKQNAEAHERIDLLVKQIERRIHSLEQPVWTLDRTPLRWNKCSEGPCTCTTETRTVSCWRLDLTYVPRSQVVPYDTKALDLGANRLGTLNKDTFKGMILLTELDLFDNQIEYLPGSLFDSLENLINLKIHKNRLKQLDEKMLIININLETLDLSNNELTAIPPNFFRALRRMTVLHLSSNRLEELDESLFSEMTQLEDLDLSRNDLTELPAHLFTGLYKLKSIKMNNNHIKALPEELFHGLDSLEVLQMQNNAIAHLPPKVFQDLRNLSQLVLTGNSLVRLSPGLFSNLGQLHELHVGGNLLEHLTAGTFAGLDRLEKLFLLSNNLREIDRRAFEGMPNLLWLALNNNLLTTLPADVFKPVTKLQRMQLDSNQFMFLPEGTLEPIKNIQYINLIKNPWHCDCAILYLTRWINEHPDLIWDYQPKCRGPGELGGRSVNIMTFNDVCDGEWKSLKKTNLLRRV